MTGNARVVSQDATRAPIKALGDNAGGEGHERGGFSRTPPNVSFRQQTENGSAEVKRDGWLPNGSLSFPEVMASETETGRE